jgi:FkbM family methyltransferase
VILSTARLFASLLRQLRVGTVCDVGSMNGADAVRFRVAVPEARVLALEPNPRNFALMQRDAGLRAGNIELLPWAASNYDGVGELFLVEADYAQSDPRRGMSSLYRRSGEWSSDARVPVRITRLDSLLRHSPGPRLALWIDTEGAAFEVIEGLSGISAQVALVHVEVETAACIGARQRLYPEVKQLLSRLGLIELATDLPREHIQFNALFISGSLGLRERCAVQLLCARERLRYLAGRMLARLCPACTRRYRALRLRWS